MLCLWSVIYKQGALLLCLEAAFYNIPGALGRYVPLNRVLFSGSQFHICQFKTESIRKLSNFNFQWTKTFYQNNLSILYSFLHI